MDRDECGLVADHVQPPHDMVTVSMMSSDTRPASRASESTTTSDSARSPSPTSSSAARRTHPDKSKSLMFSIDSLLTHSHRQRRARSPDVDEEEEREKRLRVTGPPLQSYLMPSAAAAAAMATPSVWTQHPLLNNWIRSAVPQSHVPSHPLVGGKQDSDCDDDHDSDEESESGSK